MNTNYLDRNYGSGKTASEVMEEILAELHRRKLSETEIVQVLNIVAKDFEKKNK